MAPSLRFGSLVLLAVVPWMLVAGCGDGDVTTFGSAGSSGLAGSGGAHPGSGGTHASAGTGGKSGGSSGGTDVGGGAGEGGEAMSAGGASGGTGGASGGTGGASGGTGGSGGGLVGSAGAGATSGAPEGTAGALDETAGAGGAADNVLKNCAYQCATDDDCKIDGEPQSHFCNPIRHHCEDYTACEAQADCAAVASYWYGPCTDDADCTQTLGDVCVAFGGRGACASPPDPVDGCTYALGPDEVPVTLARFGATGNVEVCQSPDGVCVDKTCQFSCTSFLGGCTDTECNADTGMCDCSSSSECTTPSKPVCGAGAQCGCATSDQCALIAAKGFDQCYSGKCGCSSAAVCKASPYKNAPPVCE